MDFWGFVLKSWKIVGCVSGNAGGTSHEKTRQMGGQEATSAEQS